MIEKTVWEKQAVILFQCYVYHLEKQADRKNRMDGIVYNAKEKQTVAFIKRHINDNTTNQLEIDSIFFSREFVMQQ